MVSRKVGKEIFYKLENVFEIHFELKYLVHIFKIHFGDLEVMVR